MTRLKCFCNRSPLMSPARLLFNTIDSMEMLLSSTRQSMSLAGVPNMAPAAVAEASVGHARGVAGRAG